ncbi:hypothetical protein PVAP13_9KG538626 [Panicum virgatum]|uniref:SMP domain-containing protein n=1 Tax=Panicum virgatum TaxID=38727 RepID=A0A8T0NP31_PANVG|nr:hypothetical protein PVAP13_9KG538626 [Panicum virgatum]
MSKEERRKRQPANPDGQGQDRPGGGGGGAVLYGDVFAVEGELARTPVAPQDPATMQAAESAVLGRAPRGGAAAAMQSAARRNERLGVVARDDGDAAECGVAVTEARVPGARVVTEFVADQPVGQYIEAAEDDGAAAEADELGGGGAVRDGTKITIGEALEATAFSADDQPVEPSDAAAIAAAEARASGADDEARPDGPLAARARARTPTPWRGARRTGPRCATSSRTRRRGWARTRRWSGRTRRGWWAPRCAAARPGGVGASIAAAARLNRGRQ